MDEIYKNIDISDVKDNMYSVSNYGNIKNNKTGHILKPTLNPQNEYLYVSLMQNNNTAKKIYVHLLVNKVK